MAKKYSQLELEDAYKLFILLNQTSDALRKLRQRDLEVSEITMEQAATLICVKNLGKEATSSELSKWLFREPNTITSLVNGLEKRGLIRREVSQENKTIKKLILTEEGEKCLEQTSDLEFLYNSILKLTPKKQEQLKSILEVLKEHSFRSLGLDAADYTHFRDIPIKFSD